MKRVALGVFLLGAIASPAFADLTIQYSGTVNMLPMLEAGTAKMTTRIETRSDRSRVTRWGTDAKAPRSSPADSSIEIIREDKHLRWEIIPSIRSYLEYPWPDTAQPVSQAEIKAQMKASIPDSVQQRMDALDDLITEVKATGEHATILGLDAEHFVVVSRMRNRPKDLPPGFDFGGQHDLWVAKDVPRLDEIHQELDAFDKRTSLSEPSYESGPKSPAKESLLPGHADKIDGLPVHYIARMRMMDSTGVAEYAKAKASAPADSSRERDPLEESIDPETGMMTMMDMELTLLSLSPIDDARFDVPPGYKRDESLSRPAPKPATRPKAKRK